MPNVQAARVSAFDHAFDAIPGDGFPAGEDLASSGAPHTVSVETVFRGVGIGAKILPFPREAQRRDRSRHLLAAGAALVVVALAIFVAVAIDVARERDTFAVWSAGGKNTALFAWKDRSVVVDVLFGACLLAGGGSLTAGLSRRRQKRDRAAFLVGSAPEVDAPVDPRFVGAPAHPLVTADGDDWIVNATPHMRGALSSNGTIRSLAELARDGASSFRLQAGARASLVCGATTFLLAAVPQPRQLPRPFFNWKREELIYTGGAALVLSLLLLVIFAVPPDPRSLSLDLMSNENHLLTFRIAPPELRKDSPPFPNKVVAVASGAAGARAAGPAGVMGKKTSLQRDRAFSIKGPKDNLDPHFAQVAAEMQARDAGVNGVLKKMSGPMAAIFSRDTSALGNQAADVMGNLMGSQIGEAYGVGGLSTVDTGAGGGGQGEHVLGVGRLGVIGPGAGITGKGPGYGRAAGGLGTRRTKTPDILIADASVRGSLDKEIIRRIVRRHVNEVKYCYEQELTKQPALGGRLVVQFMISGRGQVISSLLQSSTMGNARVENCTVQAVRRWSFPEPQGGGLVTVTYPFSLTPAG